MPLQATPNQKSAIDSRGALLVSAAAGSGKTAVLVERVMGCILDPVNPVDVNRLLVVTFTNAAAAEMQERIRKRLAEEYQKDPFNLRLLRQQMLLSKANISTIDSFCKSLITEHFDRLGLSPDFTLLSENRLALIKKEAMEETLNHFLEVRKEAFCDLAKIVGAGQATKNLEEAIESIYNYIRSLPFPKQWTDKVRALYASFEGMDSSPFGEALLHRAALSLRRAVASLTSVIHRLPEDPVVEEKRGDLLKAALAEWQNALAAVEAGRWDDAVLQCRGIQKISFAGSKITGSSEIKALTETMKNLSDKLSKSMHKLFCFTDEECLAQCRLLTDPVNLLLDSVWEYSRRIDEKKKEENCLDFSDVEYAALSLLVTLQDGKPVLTPYAAAICESFDHVMVDEYQDVNDLQSAIFNAISNNGQRLFAVGDIKQSIYRFRKANPKNFLSLLQRYPDYDGVCSPGKVILDGNFRSRPPICQTVNDLFSLLMTETAGDVLYDRSHMLQPMGKFPQGDCPVVMDFLHAEDDRTAIELEADRIAWHVKQAMETPCVSDGEELRPAKAGDCVILLRSPKKRAASYVKRLREHGIPAIAEQSDDFFERPEIARLVSLLQALDNPTDDVALLACLLSPLFGFTADEIAAIRGKNKKIPLYLSVEKAAQNGNRKATAFITALQELRTYAATVSPDHLLLRIYDQFGYLSAVQVMENGDRCRQNLLTLKELAKECGQSGYDRLDGFVRYINKLKEEAISFTPPTAAETGDAVRIMSIHHSKGLQFPVCILAGCGIDFNRTEATAPVLLDEKLGIGLTLNDDEHRIRTSTFVRTAVEAENRRAELSEELRVLYVAMTRAVDRLILITANSSLPKTIQTAAGNLAGNVSETFRLDPELILSAPNYGQLLLYFALLHPAGNLLRTKTSTEYGLLPAAEGSCVICLPQAAEIPEPPAVTPIQTAPTDAFDEALYGEICRRLSYENPYKPLQHLFSKRSVSQLVHGESPQATDPVMTRPAFLQKDGLSPAEKGTALHQFMQYADYANAALDPEREKQRLVEKAFITRAQADSIKTETLNAFFRSPLYARMERSPRLLREQRFMSQIPITALDPTLPPDFKNEQVVIQGIADCIFEEEDRWIVVDYKTDRVADPAVLAERYAEQLQFYAKMLRETTGKETRELLIYSFHLDQILSIPLKP